MSPYSRLSIGVAGSLVVILGFFLPWYIDSSFFTYNGWLLLQAFIAAKHLQLNGTVALVLLCACFTLFLACLALGCGGAAYLRKRPELGMLYRRLGGLGLFLALVIWIMFGLRLTSPGLLLLLLGFLAILGSGLSMRE